MSYKTQQLTLPESTPRSSKMTMNIAGILIYIYGVDVLTTQQSQDATVIFHAQGRTRDYHDAEELAHQILFETRKVDSFRKGLVVATMDNRNHGTRTIGSVAVHEWRSGNPKHAHDLLSTIDGTVADIRTVVKFLQSYIEDSFKPTQFIVSGMSLGGHVAWNMLSEEPRMAAAIVIVGSPSLTDRMVERLHAAESDDPTGARRWTLPIQKLYQERDERVAGVKGKAILIMNGAIDSLVPSRYTDSWVKGYGGHNDVAFHVYENTGHYVSLEMMEKLIDWVSGKLN